MFVRRYTKPRSNIPDELIPEAKEMLKILNAIPTLKLAPVIGIPKSTLYHYKEGGLPNRITFAKIKKFIEEGKHAAFT